MLRYCIFFSSEFTRNEWVCFRTSAVVRAGVHGVAPLAPVADALDVHAAHLHHVHSAHGRDGHLRPGLLHRTLDLRARHSVSATRTYYRKEWKIFPIASMYPLNQVGIFFVHGFFFHHPISPFFFFSSREQKWHIRSCHGNIPADMITKLAWTLLYLFHVSPHEGTS